MADKKEEKEKKEEKADLFKAHLTVNKLRTRVDNLERDKEMYKDKITTLQTDMEMMKTQNGDLISHQKREIDKLTERKSFLEEEVKSKRQEIIDIKDKNRKDVEELRAELQGQITELKAELLSKESKLDMLSKFEKQKGEMEMNITMLKEDLQREKKDRATDVHEKEREKLQATERLRKDMLYKIKETKANLLALNDEQLHTTTRLAILQNHQLTTELEYQSKQTEKLLFKNNKLGEQVSSLKRDIEIHKQVENELAKRSHFCQKVIQKLNQRIKTMEEETKSPQMKGQKIPQKEDRKSIEKAKRTSDELLNFLEAKLEEAEKKIATAENDYELLENDYGRQQLVLEKMREKYNKAALLLTEFLDNLLSGHPNILQDSKDLYLDIDRLKTIPIEELDKEEKAALVLVLLKQLQPYLSDINLSVGSRSPHNESLHKFLSNVNIQKQMGTVSLNDDDQLNKADQNFLPPIQGGAKDEHQARRGEKRKINPQANIHQGSSNRNKSFERIPAKGRPAFA